MPTVPRRSRAQVAAIERRQAAERLGRLGSTVPGLSVPWAQRHQPRVLAGDFALTEQARRRHPAVRWWWGSRVVDGRNGAWCYLCDVEIVGFARNYPMTAKAELAILEHRDRVHSQAPNQAGPSAPPAQGGGSPQQES